MPGILVDPEWLGDYIGDRRVRIVDVRDREAYTEGHIPGTVQLDLKDLGENRDGCDTSSRGIRPGRIRARHGAAGDLQPRHRGGIR